MPRSKHRRHGKTKPRRQAPPSELALYISPRADEILATFRALINERLRQTIGPARPWTEEEHEEAMRQLCEEGIIDTQNLLPELLREIIVVKE
jgi:hypothetical protein